jgi:hypothetical protein
MHGNGQESQHKPIYLTFEVMIRNMSDTDQLLRVAFAALVVLLNFMGKLDGLLGTVLMIWAAYLLITSLIGYSPVYAAWRRIRGSE